MCGICGRLAFPDGTALDALRLRTMRDVMLARGPDSFGEWTSAGAHVWLGHRRLAIIDLSERGHQPMLSADGSIAITFNGEIYNHVALRSDLEEKGHIFKSSSDTEVLIEAYRAWGPHFVSRLRGMFAFALWDENKKELLLARDPYGIKPLYYSTAGRAFTFASSVKALISDPGQKRKPDAAGLAGFFIFGSVPEPWTIYQDIRAVEAGTFLQADAAGKTRSTVYQSLPAILTQSAAEAGAGEVPAGQLRERFAAAVLDSVRHHLVADVPVGAFLSAGVDSGALIGLMRDAGQDSIKTVTLTYEEYEGTSSNEGPLARRIGEHYGTTHTERVVTANEFHDDLPRIVAAMDQPSIDGINTFFVSKATREQGLKVAISGVGGDELLGGYSTFQSLPKLASSLRYMRGLARLARPLEAAVALGRAAGLPLHPKSAGLVRYGGSIPGAYLLQRALFLPAELRPLIEDRDMLRRGLQELQPLRLLETVAAAAPATSFAKVAALESCFYLRNQLLRDSDWASMAHSLELRTPLVDVKLLAAVAPLMLQANRPSGKRLLAEAPSKPLPRDIVERPKTGFQIPVEKWLQQMPLPRVKGAAARPFSRRWARQVAALQNVI